MRWSDLARGIEVGVLPLDEVLDVGDGVRLSALKDVELLLRPRVLDPQLHLPLIYCPLSRGQMNALDFGAVCPGSAVFGR